MDVLCYLANRQGTVVPRQRLLEHLWPDVVVSDDVLTQSISELRAVFGDNRAAPTFIRTIPKRGYMLVAEVSMTHSGGTVPMRSRLAAIGFAFVVAALAGMLLTNSFYGDAADSSETRIAVLPFRTLTGDADSFSAGLSTDINQLLANEPGFRVVVVSPALVLSSNGAFDFRAIAERTDLVLEGSVRVVGERIRITVQLIEIATGFQRWSQSYDRLTGDMLGTQLELSAIIVSGLTMSVRGIPLTVAKS